MGVNIDEILASLEETEKTAEETLADNLSDPVATETPNEPADEATSEDTSDDTVELTEDDMEKIAAECDSQGRIMARSFVDEINRLADDTETATSEEHVQQESEEHQPEEEKVAAENDEELTSADYIIGSLYNSYFGEEENNG